MSTRIHKKIPLAAPLIAIAESITRVPPDGKITINSRNGMLLYFLSGEALLSINGSTSTLIHEGSVVITPGPSARTYTSAGNTDTPLHFYGISFSRTIPRSIRNFPPHEKEFFSIIRKAFTQSAIIPEGINVNLRQGLLALRQAFDDKSPGGSILLYTAAVDICVETARLILNRQDWQKAGPGRRKGRFLVNAALEHMLRNLKSNPQVDKVAWSVKVSTEHLCRVFRRELETTPQKALRNLQIDAAKSLLINSTIDVYRIAEQTGFASVTAFGRYFKATVGMTPTEYRSSHGGNFVRSAEVTHPSVFSKSSSGTRRDPAK